MYEENFNYPNLPATFFTFFYRFILSLLEFFVYLCTYERHKME